MISNYQTAKAKSNYHFDTQRKDHREDVIRYLTIQVEALDEGPSPLLKQSRNYVESSTRGQVFQAETDGSSETAE